MIAVSAWFDEGLETVIRDLWRRMAEAGVDDSLHTGPFRPHVTLGIWEELPVDAAARLLGAVTSELAPFPLKFRAIGIYPGHPSQPDRQPGVWLAPTVTPALRELHERVHSALHEVGRGPVYRHLPDRWEPHCTVAWRLDRRLLPLATEVVLEANLLPLAATVTRIGLIDTPAEIELDCLLLADVNRSRAADNHSDRRHSDRTVPIEKAL